MFSNDAIQVVYKGEVYTLYISTSLSKERADLQPCCECGCDREDKLTYIEIIEKVHRIVTKNRKSISTNSELANKLLATAKRRRKYSGYMCAECIELLEACG